MKKAISLILVLVMCLPLHACGSKAPKGTSFENQDALLASLNGMWMVDDYNKDEYYVFREGNIYRTSLVTYEYEVEQFLQETLDQGGFDAWRKTDFQTVCAELGSQEVLRNPETEITFKPQKGTIIIDEGKSWEKKIIVTDYGVVLMTANSEFGTDLLKVADEVSFSSEKFEEIFNRVKKKTTASKTVFLPTAEEYGELLQNVYGQVRDWKVVSHSKDSMIRSLDGTLSAKMGSFVITDSAVTLGMGTVGEDGNPYVVHYNTLEDGAVLIIRDKLYYDLNSALALVAQAVQEFPQALTAGQLYELFEREAVLSDGVYQFNKTVGYVTYQIYQRKRLPNMYITILVSVEDTIPMADFVNEGTPTLKDPETSSGNSLSAQDSVDTVSSLEQLLVPSKVWGISWTDDYGVTWTTDYVFDGEGNFKMLLSDGMQYVVRHQGTYSIAGNTVSIFNELSGLTEQYVYDYHADNGTWEQKSVTGYAYDHAAGDTFTLHENTDITTERFAELYDILGEDNDWD